MFIVIAEVTLVPERRDDFLRAVLPAMQADQERTPDIPARFDIVADPQNPNRLFFYEVYASRDAYEAHNAEPSYQAWLEGVRPWFAGPATMYVMGESLVRA